MKWRQRQRAGDNSQNIQGEIVHVGVSYSDVKEIFSDLYEQNFPRLTQVAHEAARERAEEFAYNFWAEINERAPDAVSKLSDPGVQASILDAQSGYAKYGDRELGETLVSLLVDRAIAAQRSTLQLALTEAIAMAPKLTQSHLNALSLVFLVRDVKNKGLNAHLTFYAKQMEDFSPLLSDTRLSSRDYLYLQATGTLALRPVQQSIHESWRRSYPGLFAKGWKIEELPPNITNAYGETKFFTPCIRDASRVQINAIDEETLEHKIDSSSEIDEEVKPEARQQLHNLLTSHLLSDDDINMEVRIASPRLLEVFNLWEDKGLDLTNITAVGVALAHANLVRLVPSFKADLKIWIPDE